jgi:uncharacterized membrane-anchored protein
MNWKEWLAPWNMKSLKLKTAFLEMNFEPMTGDKDAAWELYIELSTRITTQPLEEMTGDNLTALDSVYELFELTREILKKYNRSCIEFSKLAIPILNQIIRPFTAKWHTTSKTEDFNSKYYEEFRKELNELQNVLIIYTAMLGDMAGIDMMDNIAKLQYM